MPNQKEQNDIWVEGVEPAPQRPIRKSPPQPKVAKPRKMPPVQNVMRGPKLSRA